jgi:hypothetical protein
VTQHLPPSSPSILPSHPRTFDPEEADFFFVPTAAGCIYDVYGWNPIPMWPPKFHGAKKRRPICSAAHALLLLPFKQQTLNPPQAQAPLHPEP